LTQRPLFTLFRIDAKLKPGDGNWTVLLVPLHAGLIDKPPAKYFEGRSNGVAMLAADLRAESLGDRIQPLDPMRDAIHQVMCILGLMAILIGECPFPRAFGPVGRTPDNELRCMVL
jgi:hypothetical protein